MRRLLIIPAAGRGSRLDSAEPKVLTRVAGRPMLDHLERLYRGVVHDVVVVAHPSFAARVRQRLAAFGWKASVLEQAEPTGMLDAILLARQAVQRAQPDRVWITWCDQIAIRPETVQRMIALERRDQDADVIMPTARSADPYTHLEFDEADHVTRFLQRREGDAMPAEGQSDAGFFSLSRRAFLEDLRWFAGAAQEGTGTAERNFLPFIVGRRVVAFPCDPIEAIGVNTPEELRQVEPHIRPRISIVIPAFNEQRFIGTLLERIKAVDIGALGFDREIIVVDDCSKDGTAAIVAAVDGVTLVRMPANGGKGRAVREGIARATGEFVLIQDADLEYDPEDYKPILQALRSSGADIVYGSRYLKRPGAGIVANLISGKHPKQSLPAYLGGQSLSFIALAFTGAYLTDTVTALKLYPRSLLLDMGLETSGFELDHEMTAKSLARGMKIVEVPISYFPRSRAEGKKIGLKDWFCALKTFRRYGRRRAATNV
ncbi:MAG: glycosyltransferase [Acidobacteriota bacterium]|nr:glycosyltransferase [Acidobacteriota bacterium]